MQRDSVVRFEWALAISASQQELRETDDMDTQVLHKTTERIWCPIVQDVMRHVSTICQKRHFAQQQKKKEH